MSHTILVRAEQLTGLPEPIRRYFDNWGRSEVILGIHVIRVDTKLHFDHDDWRRKETGIGPGHSVECNSYDVGEVRFHEWLRTHPDEIQQIYGSEEHHNDYDDDD